MINESNKTSEETNLQKIGNLIKIPYDDLIEEAKTQPSFYINGFPIIELDETNQELYQDDEMHDIETKKGFQLKRKAFFIENYYMNYSDEELLGVHCSKCYMNGFNKNELLYFKDRKSLISYLKYCFIFLKKNLFMDHTIYMNNRYDLLKIDHTYFIGFHFLIPKTLCKACFIQLINKEFLLSKLKNEISDTDGDTSTNIVSPKKNTSLLKKKRKIPKKINENKNSEEKNKNEINGNKKEKTNLKSIQISPIIIPISNPSTPKKKIKKNYLKKFTKKKIKKNDITISKYNENVTYDEINNIIIISKKISTEIKSNSTEKKPNVVNDSPKILKEKDKEEISKNGAENLPKKFYNINTTKENVLDNSNNKTEKKEKNTENDVKDVKDTKLITTKINNPKETKENNMNKFSLKKKYNNKNSNNNNNNNLIYNKEIYLSFVAKQFINMNFCLHQQKIIEDSNLFFQFFEQIFNLAKNIYNSMKDNSIFGILNILKNKLSIFFRALDDINERMNDNIILMEYSLFCIKRLIQMHFQTNMINEQQKYFQEFLFYKQNVKEVQERYKILVNWCFEGLVHLNQTVEEMSKYYSATIGNVQSA